MVETSGYIHVDGINLKCSTWKDATAQRDPVLIVIKVVTTRVDRVIVRVDAPINAPNWDTTARKWRRIT